MIDRIYLVGFMGVGKSTVGRELALQLKWSFIDLDSEIEKSQRAPVREIFSRYGESRFRQLEREQLERFSSALNTVIALGGGAYVDPGNRSLVDSTGVAVWLQASLPTVIERIRPDGARPLFSDPEQTRQLFEARLPSYRLARIHVLTDNRLPDTIADEIARQVSKL